MSEDQRYFLLYLIASRVLCFEGRQFLPGMGVPSHTAAACVQCLLGTFGHAPDFVVYFGV